MLEIGLDELQVLDKLVHPESIEQIIAEISLPEPVVIDIVRQLFHFGFIKLYSETKPVPLSFDVDQIKITYFQLTAKGINEINKN
jgi:hypothetical protein